MLRLLCFCLLASIARVHAGDFHAGASQVDITPPVGTPMAGFYSMRASTGTLDPLHAKAIVVELGGVKAAFVALDMAYTTRPLVLAARKLITEQTGIPGENVMISATHTHSGPVITRDSPMDDITGGKTEPVLEFAAKLPGMIAQAVSEANAKLAPAKSSVVIGHEEHLSFNRRFEMKDGTFSWQGPKMSPKILRPLGPIDPDVGVWQLATEGKGSALFATYVNFAMHPTVMGGLQYSADYPFYLSKRLAEYRGPNMLTFFANGCCGNINQVNVKWAAPQNGSAEGERVGTVLAAAVFRALPDLQVQAMIAPRVRTEMVRLERRKFTDEEIADARKVALRISSQKLPTPLMAKAVCILDTVNKRDVPLEVEVQVVALSNDFAVVSLPGEIFVELGLALKKASPFKNTFIAELANGSMGYIPNREAYPQGLYEVFSARGEIGSGEKLVEVALKLLNEVAKP